MRVAAVQLWTGMEKGPNRVAAAAAVRRAAGDGAELVVLPEATMCGFGEPSADLASLAEPLDGPFVAALLAAAAETGTAVVAGMFEPAPGPGRRVFNTAVAVGPTGLLAAYRKVHLYDAAGWRESDRVAPGEPSADPAVFGWAGHRVGLLTCYDLRFPESARMLAEAGATTLAVPAHWVAGPGKVLAWTTLVRARAIESTAYVVGAAKPRPQCSGNTMVVAPDGRILARLSAVEEGTAVADLDLGALAGVRARFPVLEQRRFRVVPGSDPAR